MDYLGLLCSRFESASEKSAKGITITLSSKDVSDRSAFSLNAILASRSALSCPVQLCSSIGVACVDTSDQQIRAMDLSSKFPCGHYVEAEDVC